jgi:hypothetical protein
MVGRAQQSIVQVRLPDRNDEVDTHGEGGDTRKESRQDEDSAHKLGEGGDITQPHRDTQAGHPLRRVVQVSEHLVSAMSGHDGAERKAHHEKGERLQTIEIAQEVLPEIKRDKIIAAGLPGGEVGETKFNRTIARAAKF